MLGLISDLQEYASDDEEEHQIVLIKDSIAKLSQKMDEVSGQCLRTDFSIE